MTRRTSLLRIAAASVLAATIPLSVAIGMAQRAAVVAVEHAAASLAAHALAEIEQDVGAMRAVIEGLADPAPGAACQPAHLAAMRAAVLSTGSVLEVGFLDGDRVACTAWGGPARIEALPAPDWTRPDGASVWFALAGGGAARYRGFRLGNHYVLASAPPPDAGVKDEADVHLALLRPGATTPFALGGSGQAPGLGGLPEGTGLAHVGDAIRARAVSEGLGIAAVVEMQHPSLAEVWTANAVWIGLLGSFAGLLTGLGTAYVLRQQPSLRDALAAAIDRGELEVRYQPLVRLKDGRCVGAEALVRWTTGTGEEVAPSVFVPIAEESGLIRPLTHLVLSAVVGDLAGHLRGLDLPVGVNVAAASLHDDRLRDTAARLLAAQGVARHLLKFECTERDVIATPRVARAVTALRAAGHPVMLDDFGTGYSGLSVLQTVAIDAVKIDHLFVHALGDDTGTPCLIGHMVAMAHDLGVETVAEGVETEAQRDTLHTLGVGFGQGWLFGRPMDARAFRAYVLAERRALGPDLEGGSGSGLRGRTADKAA